MESNLLHVLRLFEASGCRFILVGGLAAVFHGAPVQTYDIDLLYAVDAANIEFYSRFSSRWMRFFGFSQAAGFGHKAVIWPREGT